MVWRGVEWCGVEWRGVVWCGEVIWPPFQPRWRPGGGDGLWGRLPSGTKRGAKVQAPSNTAKRGTAGVAAGNPDGLARESLGVQPQQQGTK